MATPGTDTRRTAESEAALSIWAENVIKAWILKMGQLGMLGGENQTGRLAQSFTHTIKWEARGEDRIEYLNKISFAFYAYGKFVDYGLGRGTDMDDRFETGRAASTNPRKRKEWVRKPWRDALKLLEPIIKAQAARATKSMMMDLYSSPGVDTRFRTRDI